MVMRKADFVCFYFTGTVEYMSAEELAEILADPDSQEIFNEEVHFPILFSILMHH
jgi:hypothetical protein